MYLYSVLTLNLRFVKSRFLEVRTDSRSENLLAQKTDSVAVARVFALLTSAHVETEV